MKIKNTTNSGVNIVSPQTAVIAEQPQQGRRGKLPHYIAMLRYQKNIYFLLAYFKKKAHTTPAFTPV
jgi:hypothetical protein